MILHYNQKMSKEMYVVVLCTMDDVLGFLVAICHNNRCNQRSEIQINVFTRFKIPM